MLWIRLETFLRIEIFLAPRLGLCSILCCTDLHGLKHRYFRGREEPEATSEYLYRGEASFSKGIYSLKQFDLPINHSSQSMKQHETHPLVNYHNSSI